MRYQIMPMAHRYEDALCAQSDRDPREWDAPGEVPAQDRTMTRPARALHAAAMCGPCPLLAVCAEDALVDKPTGVIRAGVPVTSARPVAWQVRAWEAVADGRDLAAALAEHAPPALWRPEAAYVWYASTAGVVAAEALHNASLEWLEARGLLGTLRPALQARRDPGAGRG